MDRKIKILFGLLLAVIGVTCLNAASGQALPDGEGKAEYVHNCTACHRTEMVTRVKKTPDEWRKSVDEMASRGTDGTKEDLDKVVIYLDTFYSTGPAQPPATPPPSSGGGANPNGTVRPHLKLEVGRKRTGKEMRELVTYLVSLPPLREDLRE